MHPDDRESRLGGSLFFCFFQASARRQHFDTLSDQVESFYSKRLYLFYRVGYFCRTALVAY